MDSVHKDVLTKSRSWLEDNLDVTYVVDLLLSKGVITEKHYQTIDAKAEQFKKVRKLVDILRLLSPEKFCLFCEACKEGEYEHVHDYLKHQLALQLQTVEAPGDHPLYGAASGCDLFSKRNVPDPVSLSVRTKSLDSITENLLGSNCHFLVLTGIHGVGKTQLSYSFCKIATELGHIVHSWKLDCTKEDTLDRDLREFLQELRVPVREKDSILVMKKKLCPVFRTTPGYNLLILDDVTAETKDIVSQLKGLNNVKIIFTTNDSTLFHDLLDESQITLEIKGYTQSESLEFLLQSKQMAKEPEKDLVLLAKTLGHSPFGLSVARAFMLNNNISVQEYLYRLDNVDFLKRIEKRVSKGLKKYLNGYDKQLSFLQALDLSIENLKNSVGDELFSVFEMFAFLDPGYIPYWLLREACRQRVSRDTDDVDEVNDQVSELIDGLKEASIIVQDAKSSLPVQDDNGRLTIHGGIQVALRIRWEDSETICTIHHVVELLYPFVRRHIVYQEDFLENSRLTSVVAPHLVHVAKRLTKTDTEGDLPFVIKLVFTLDAIAMTYIYRGLLDYDLERQNTTGKVSKGNAEMYAKAALTLLETAFGYTTDSTEEGLVDAKRQRKTNFQLHEEVKSIISNIKMIIAKGESSTSVFPPLILEKRFEEREYVPVWKEKCSNLNFKGKFRISPEEYHFLQREEIILPDSKLTQLFFAELYMSILYTVGRIHVYQLRSKRANPTACGNFYIEKLELAKAIGEELERSTDVRLMYLDRVLVKGIFSIYIETASTGANCDELRGHLKRVMERCVSIACDSQASYEFGILFRCEGKTMCNFTIYCLRQALDACTKLVDTEHQEEDKQTTLRTARELVDKIHVLLSHEDINFLGRGPILCKMGSLLGKSDLLEDKMKACQLFLQSIETDRKNEKWNFAWKEALGGLTCLLKNNKMDRLKVLVKDYMINLKSDLDGENLTELEAFLTYLH